LIVDTQVYSNTGGQICTSGFIGQIADMASFGKHQQGKVEPRKEISLITMAHRGVFLCQTSQANPNHMLKGFIRGLNSRRPALFSCYTTCQPEHGVGDDASHRQAKLALEGRAFPYVIYDPDGGPTFRDRVSLHANPEPKKDWPSYNLEFVDEEGTKQKMRLPMTFADFAATEGRFGKHFRAIPPDVAEDDHLVPFHEFLELDAEGRADRVPFIWATDRERRLRKMSVSLVLVTSAEERLDFWRMLQDLAS
jgi:pyruvate-ferredoxin/flavodoxin oxidoreductase